MLNHLVHKDFTNEQYHEAGEDGRMVVRSENSIFFELDGPYRAMILPSSKEEDKLLKKRYAVFNEDGSLAELKGFEVKRRGELQLIKTFQSQIFEKFLLGGTLKDCYAEVATVADKWLDVLFTKAHSLPDEELVDLIAENRSMSKTLAEYAGQKSTSISTARRLAEFLGEQMVKDKGLACKFIISSKPMGAPVTERAVPVAIFSAELSVKRHFLRKWLKDNSLEDFELRSILDWDYYIERLGSVVQKLITIPAALQKITNPVPRIRHPDWLFRRVASLDDKFKQHRVDEMFARQKPVIRSAEEEEEAQARSQAAALVVRSPSPEALPAPNIKKDYSGWIAYMKPIWRQKRKELLSANRGGGGFGSKTGTLGSMMNQQSSMLSSSVWDIVQISPVSDRPGEFKMWLLIRDTLQSVRLRIPRQFLVNFIDLPTEEDAFPESCEVEAISRTLPRNQRALNLVRLTTSEDDYLRDEALYAELLHGPNVDGAYELQVPLIVRALLRLGSTCVPDVSKGVTLNRGLDRHFALDDLKKSESSLSRRRYLDKGRNLRYIYLFHITNDFRHVFGLFLPNGNAKVYVVERGKAREVPNLEKYYADQLRKKKEGEDERIQQNASVKRAEGVFEYNETISVDVAYPTTEDIALRAISRELTNLASQRSMASLLVVHSPKPRSYFDDRVPGSNQFPLITIQSSRADNTFQSAIAWQAPACRKMIHHYLHASVWIKERIDIADRFDVPVGNLDKDIPVFLADIDFARRLHKADLTLWWSAGARPDLGGREADANATSLADELANPEIGRPGCYSNACLEVEVRNLAVDAVLQSALVYELEGGEGTGIDEGAHNLDDYAKGTAHAPHALGDAILPTQTFNMLRSMVKGWSIESAKPGGGHYHVLLDHFWRWISSPSAKLYDPALYRFVHGLMRKTFSQLLAEFRRLGSEVIHADFGRIFLLTSKPSSSTAYAYANYIVSSVTTRELFRYVRIDIVKFWDQLVWMDAANSAGIVCEHPELDEESLNDVTVEMHFNIGTYLPPAVQQDFESVIGRFVHGMLSAKRSQGSDLRTPLRLLQNGLNSALKPTQAMNEIGKEDAGKDAAKSLISEGLTRQLLKAVTNLKERHATKSDPEAFHFPILPGSHLKLKNPVLEFIKTTCAVLALSKDVGEEVVVLKRNLLDLIGVREFAREAIFHNPCLPFKVPMVVCKLCNSIRGTPYASSYLSRVIIDHFCAKQISISVATSTSS